VQVVGAEVGDEAVVEDAGAVEGLTAVGPAGAAEVASYAAERVELRARLARAGVVLLTDAAYPGWEATANDRPLPIRRANGGLRALLLEPGDYRIVFAYRPLALRLGAGLALLGLALTGLFLAEPAWLRRPLRSASMGPTEEERT
jgi:anti-sigma factor RsiW